MPVVAIAFEELEGSPTIGLSQRGAVAVRAFRCAWSDWPALVRLLVGHFELVGAKPVFSAPLEFPGVSNLIVSELAVEPFDGGAPEGTEVTSLSSGTNRYLLAGARVTATYRTLYDSENTGAGRLARRAGGHAAHLRSGTGNGDAICAGADLALGRAAGQSAFDA